MDVYKFSILFVFFLFLGCEKTVIKSKTRYFSDTIETSSISCSYSSFTAEDGRLIALIFSSEKDPVRWVLKPNSLTIAGRDIPLYQNPHVYYVKEGKLVSVLMTDDMLEIFKSDSPTELHMNLHSADISEKYAR